MAEKDLVFKATLKSLDRLEVFIPKRYNANGVKHLYLYEDGSFKQELHILSKSDSSKNFIYQIDKLPIFVMGSEYEVYDERNINFPVDLSYLCRLDKYIDRLSFKGEMGAIYSKQSTTFRVFSPLASEGNVLIYDETGKKQLGSYFMTKDPNSGIFETIVPGDLDGKSYLYLLKVNGEYVSGVDIYSKSVTKNSTKGFIINPKKVEVELNNDCLGEFNSPTEAIIYELNVRDMTSDKSVGIINKGKYLGLTEEGVKTKKNNPVGIDYLKELGVTHVQILPIFDFISINDENPELSYNWGYDPLNYNSPEGSYSTDPSSPYARIIETKKMVSSLHKNGIRVIMDVVFNHVFSIESSSFETLCPNYYFKYDENGNLANGSWCGNEFESRHIMARKFIVDTCIYWVKEYGIDGFRFDLMGLLDVETMNQVIKECKKIKKDFIVYGEGWDMNNTMKPEQKASMNNASLMPQIGFFNDRYRDVSKGKTGSNELYMRGYLTGDMNYRDGFKHVFLGSTVALAFPPLFDSPIQSINYVECHDNNTLYDKLKVCCFDDSADELLRRLKLINAATIFACGVPFIHMGQEIGLTKKGQHNTYNSGDLLNQFKYDVLDERSDLFRFTKSCISFKKKNPFFVMNDRKTIEKSIEFMNLDKGALGVRYIDKEAIAPYSDVVMFINPTKESINVTLDDYYKIVFNATGELNGPVYGQHLVINGLSLVIAVK